MKKQILLVISALALVNSCYGQNNSQDGLRLDDKYKILYIISYPGKAPVATVNLVIDPKDVDSLSDIPHDQSDEICKLMRVSTIWVVKPAFFVHLLSLNDVCNLYYIKTVDQHLPVRIDNWIIDNPETLLIEQSEIVSVGVVKKSGVSSFIKIITQHPLTIRSTRKNNK